MDMGALLRDAPVLGAMRADLKSFGWTWREFGEFFERIGWNELRPMVPRDRILVFAAEKDRFFDPQVLRQMWRRWDKPDIRWYPTTHMGFVPLMPRAVVSLRDFVRELPPR